MSTQPTQSPEYQRGYQAARERFKTEEAQALYNQSLADCEANDFTRGWQKACEELGAVDPLD